MGETERRVEGLLHQAANLLGRSKNLAEGHRGRAHRLLGDTRAKIERQ